MKEIISTLLKAPDSQLDKSMVELVKKWDDPPKALQVLEVLDRCVYASLASGFTMKILDMIYNESLKIENISHEELCIKAVWRQNLI